MEVTYKTIYYTIPEETKDLYEDIIIDIIADRIDIILPKYLMDKARGVAYTYTLARDILHNKVGIEFGNFANMSLMMNIIEEALDVAADYEEGKS